MKTAIATLSCMALLALASAAIAFADPISVVSIQPDTKTVGPGDGFALDVNIATVSDLFAFQFDLGFAPGVLSATSITEGLFLPGGGSTFFIPGTIDNVAGMITGTADSLIGPIFGVNGSGTLAEVQFAALAPGASSVTLFNVQLLDSSLSPIPFSLADGSVGVQSPTVIPEPSSLLLLGSVVFWLGVARYRIARKHA